MIPQDIINQIIEKVNISEVIAEYIPVLPDGTGFKSVCPFHNDTNPSMKISPSKKIFKCFSCGAGGNVIQFVARYENISFVEAVTKLARKIGIEIENNTDPQYESKKKLYQILTESNEFYKFYLNNSEEGKIALKYLEERGIDQDIIKTFEIGLAPSEKDYLNQALNSKNFGIIDQVESGMIRKEKNDSYIDTFRSRIMFPIKDLNNRVVGFSGRIYLPGDKSPKYINSNENLIFHKSELLYNYSNANEHARRENYVFIFEGFMDVIAAYKAGVKASIATMGTALTKQHLKALNALTNKVILCFDGDQAGINATYKAAAIFSSENKIPYAVQLPDSLDPDEYLKKYGADNLKKFLLENQVNVYEYIYNVAKIDLIKDDVVSVQRFKEKVFNFLKTTNNTVKEFYLNKLSNDLNIDPTIIISDFGISLTERKPTNEIVKPKLEIQSIKKKIPAKIYRALEIIIMHSINSKDKFKLFFCDHNYKLSIADFSDYLDIFTKIAEIYSFKEQIDINELKNGLLEESPTISLLEKILKNDMIDVNNELEFKQCVETIDAYSVKEYAKAKLLGALEDDALVNDYVAILKSWINIQ